MTRAPLTYRTGDDVARFVAWMKLSPGYRLEVKEDEMHTLDATILMPGGSMLSLDSLSGEDMTFQRITLRQRP